VIRASRRALRIWQTQKRRCGNFLCDKFGDGEASARISHATGKSLKHSSPGATAPESGHRRRERQHRRARQREGTSSKWLLSRLPQPLKTNPAVVPEFDRLPSSDGAINLGLGNLFFAEFLSLLSDKEKSDLRFEPVRGPKRSRKVFLPAGGQTTDRLCGRARIRGLLNYECRRCHRPLAICYLRNNELFRFVAQADLLKPVPNVFALGPEGDVSLCMTRRRYSQIIGKPGARNLTSSRLWVVPDEQFVRKIGARSHPPKSRWAPRRSSMS